MLFLLSSIRVMNTVIDFPVGEYFRWKAVRTLCTWAEAKAGQVEEVECRVFDIIHVEIIRIGCSFLQTIILLSSCFSLFFSRQNENQMPLPKGLPEGFGL